MFKAEISIERLKEIVLLNLFEAADTPVVYDDYEAYFILDNEFNPIFVVEETA